MNRRLASTLIALVAAAGCSSKPTDVEGGAPDLCGNKCGLDEICNSQTGGIVDAATFSSCAPWPESCKDDHSCACLYLALGACPTNECGESANGIYEFRCIGD